MGLWLLGVSVLSVTLSWLGFFVCANFITLSDGAQYRVFMRTISSPGLEVSYPFAWMESGIYQAQIKSSEGIGGARFISESTVEFEGMLFTEAARSLAAGRSIDGACIEPAGGSSSASSGRRVVYVRCDLPFSTLSSGIFGNSLSSQAMLAVYAGNLLFLDRDEGLGPDSRFSKEEFEAKYHRERTTDEQVSVAGNAVGQAVKTLSSISYLLEGSISSVTKGAISAPSYFNEVKNHEFVVRAGQKISIYYESGDDGLVGITFLK